MRTWTMISSALLAPAMRTASSKTHSDAVEKSVGMRMRENTTTLSCHRLRRRTIRSRGHRRRGRGRGAARRDDVADDRLRLRLRLGDLQRHLLPVGVERL